MRRPHPTSTRRRSTAPLRAATLAVLSVWVLVGSGCATGTPQDTPSDPSTPHTDLTEHGAHLQGCLGSFCVTDLPTSIDSTEVPDLLSRLSTGALAQTAIPLRPGQTAPSSCHDVAHYIGRVVGATLTALTAAPASTDTMCGFGYLHGLLEGWAANQPPDIVGPAVFDWCARFTARPNVSLSCAHGAGHALALSYRTDLERTARACAVYSQHPSACVEGVLMTHTTSAAGQGPLQVADLDLTDPWSLCDRLPGLEVPCWRYLPETAYTARREPPDIMEHCRALPDFLAQPCGEGYGGVLLRTLRYDTNAALDACHETLAAACRLGVVRLAGAVWAASGRPPVPGPDICARSEPSERQACERLVREGMGSD